MAKLDVSSLVKKVRTKLKHYTGKWRPKDFMKVPPDLARTLGNGESIPYGVMTEVSGEESQGKTLLGLVLMSIAQAEGAYCVWVDAENSFDKSWARTHGVDPTKVAIIRPYIGSFGSKNAKKKRMTSAQELCGEAEAVCEAIFENDPDCKIFMVVDSLTALLPKEELEAGIENQNMRTKMSLASFLGLLLRRWVGLCPSFNMTIMLINQLRVNPMQLFGDPSYEPGGKAAKFYCHVRARVRRGKKSGQVFSKDGKQIGVRGGIHNRKNKLGLEKQVCGYKFYFKGKYIFAEDADSV